MMLNLVLQVTSFVQCDQFLKAVEHIICECIYNTYNVQLDLGCYVSVKYDEMLIVVGLAV